VQGRSGAGLFENDKTQHIPGTAASMHFIPESQHLACVMQNPSLDGKWFHDRVILDGGTSPPFEARSTGFRLAEFHLLNRTIPPIARLC
jgi:hypothetical protein